MSNPSTSAVKSRRIFVSPLSSSFTSKDFADKFSSYGVVESVTPFPAFNAVGQAIDYIFVQLSATEQQLKKCLSAFSGVTWKGSKLRASVAKPSWKDRCLAERNALSPPSPIPQPVLIQPELSSKHWHEHEGHMIRPLRMRPTHSLPPCNNCPERTQYIVDRRGKKRVRVKAKITCTKPMVIDPRRYDKLHMNFFDEDMDDLDQYIEKDEGEWTVTEQKQGSFVKWQRVKDADVLEEDLLILRRGHYAAHTMALLSSEREYNDSEQDEEFEHLLRNARSASPLFSNVKEVSTPIKSDESEQNDSDCSLKREVISTTSVSSEARDLALERAKHLDLIKNMFKSETTSDDGLQAVLENRTYEDESDLEVERGRGQSSDTGAKLSTSESKYDTVQNIEQRIDEDSETSEDDTYPTPFQKEVIESSTRLPQSDDSSDEDSEDESHSTVSSSDSSSGSSSDEEGDNDNKETASIKTLASASSNVASTVDANQPLKSLFTNDKHSKPFSLFAGMDLDLEEEDVPPAASEERHFDLSLSASRPQISQPTLAEVDSFKMPVSTADTPMFFPFRPEGAMPSAPSFMQQSNAGIAPFWRTETDDEIYNRWQENKSELTRNYKRRHRNAVKRDKRHINDRILMQESLDPVEELSSDDFEVEKDKIKSLITERKGINFSGPALSEIISNNGDPESSFAAASRLPARLNRGVPKTRSCVDNYGPSAKRVKNSASVRSASSKKTNEKSFDSLGKLRKKDLKSIAALITKREVIDIEAQSSSSSRHSSSTSSSVIQMKPFIPPNTVMSFTHPSQMPFAVYHPIPKPPPLLSELISLEEDAPDTDAAVLQKRVTEDANYQDRIQTLRSNGRLSLPVSYLGRESIHSFVKPLKLPEPVTDHWATLAEHAEYFSSLVKLEYKYKVNITKKLSRMIHSHFHQAAGEDGRQRKEATKMSRALARWTAKEVQKKWKLAAQVIRKRKADIAKLEQDEAGKAHLNRILEQSHQLLDKQRGDLTYSLDNDRRRTSRSASANTSQIGGDSPIIEQASSDGYLNLSGSERNSRPRESSLSGSDHMPMRKRRRLTRDSSVTSSSAVVASILELDPDLDDKEFIEDDEEDIILDSSEDGEEEEGEMDQLKKEAEMSLEELIKLHYGEREPETMAQGLGLADSNTKRKLTQNNSINAVSEGPNSTAESSNINDKRMESIPEGQEQQSDMSICSESSDSASIKPAQLQQPFLLRGQLREYQHAGFEWLVSLHKNGKNGILADEMGLGKTIQTIALLTHLACEQGIWGPHLIVVPTSVMLNWEMEFKKFLPGFKVLTYYGSIKERKAKRVGWNQNNTFNVCITSYQLIIADQQVFKRKAWHYMILDEAHNIKSFKSQRWQTMLGFNTRYRLLLSGTPIQNNLIELWALLYFLMPQGLGDHFQAEDGTTEGMGQGFANLKDFQEWFGGIEGSSGAALDKGGNMDNMTKAAINKLQTILRPFLLRRLKIDVEKQMPLKHEHVVYCRLSKRQRYLYDEFMARAQTKDTLSSGNYLSIINCLMQLRKVCNHPDLFEVRAISTSFAMPNIPSTYEPQEFLVRRKFLQDQQHKSCSLLSRNLMWRQNDESSQFACNSRRSLDASPCFVLDAMLPERDLSSILSMKEYQSARKQMLRNNATERWRSLRSISSESCQRAPIISTVLDTVQSLSLKRKPKPILGKATVRFEYVQNDASARLRQISDNHRTKSLDLVGKFACITPAVQALGLQYLALPGLEPSDILTAGSSLSPVDYDILHPSAVKLQIAFPDPSLLQYDCGKLQALAELLRKFKDGGHRVLIFTQMTKVLDLLEIFLNFHGHKYLRLDGSTKIEDRQLLTERFNTDDRILAFILSSRSGGVGINLTGADCVVFYDSDWNPAMDKQCQDRCHRIGQTRDVNIYRLVSTHTIEENMLKKAQQKIFLDKVVVQDGDFTTEHYSKLDWRDMLGDDLPVELRSEQSVFLDKARPDIETSHSTQATANHKSVDEQELQTAFALAEDEDDANAAKLAEKERLLDEGDFTEDLPKVRDIKSQSGCNDELDFMDEDEEDDEDEGGSIDEWMLAFVENNWELFS